MVDASLISVFQVLRDHTTRPIDKQNEFGYCLEMEKSFKEKVYEMCRRIPKGKVVTYGQLAKMVEHPGAARAVGMCMKTNEDVPHTPCHRVVASDGSLHGYSGEGGLGGKKRMLMEEGVKFKGERVDLKESKWME